MKLQITDIQKGCTHDGPGLRTTVFLWGCPLHCAWCHNPETCTQKPPLFFREEKCIGCMECFLLCPVEAHSIQQGEHRLDRTKCISCMSCTSVCYSGALEPACRWMEVEAILAQVVQDRAFYRDRGGLTVSGGEPTGQPEGLLALLQGAKRELIHTCLETCGMFPGALVQSLTACTDLFLYDIKDTDPERFRKNTGGALNQVLENLRRIDALGGKTVLRCILIPEVNLVASHAEALAQLWSSLENCAYVELLPYHPFGLSKAEQLGQTQTQFREPTRKEMETFAAWLKEKNVSVKLYGSMV